MRIVLQRVKEADVEVSGKVISSIGKGIFVFLGIEEEDTAADIEWLVQKIGRLRIFSDENGKMNLDIRQAKGEWLVVSQFTLFASVKKGNRPSFIRAARPEIAIPLYQDFIQSLHSFSQIPVATGEFGAMMDIHLTHDGPVTLVIDSKQRE